MTFHTKAFVIAIVYFASSYGVAFADNRSSENETAVPFDHHELQGILKSIDNDEFDDDKVAKLLPRLVISCKPESTRSLAIAALLRIHEHEPKDVRPYLPRFAPLLVRAKRIQEVDDICTMLLSVGESPEDVVAVIEEKFANQDEDDFFANGKMAAFLLMASPEDSVIRKWLETQMHHPETNHRVAAMNAISHLGDAGKPSLPVIRQGLTDESPAVRVAAAWATWKIDGNADATVPVLFAALEVEGETFLTRPFFISEWMPDHRIIAVLHLGQMTKRKAEIASKLITLLDDEDEIVQCMTLRSLGKLGECGPEIIEAVREKSKGENDIGSEAKNTLKRLTKENPQ
ncbi:MAG: HEAT repeat domain-containing protein [Planctomycetota bacterium]|nr:HEAT repeat domain-containing protein [Planctomycetota bacterium]MDA1212760.1 HEAT repeat domain-containing protein [Planctomycetota bacterium]